MRAQYLIHRGVEPKVWCIQEEPSVMMNTHQELFSRDSSRFLFEIGAEVVVERKSAGPWDIAQQTPLFFYIFHWLLYIVYNSNQLSIVRTKTNDALKTKTS